MYKLSEDTFGLEEKKAVLKLFNNKSKLTYGKNVKTIEKKLSIIQNRKYCVMVNSGSSANLLGIAAALYDEKINLSKGDEIIVPTLSWSTTYAPLIQLGLKLVFVDINKDTLNIDENKIFKAITKKTRAIFAVNILGLSCNYTKILKIVNNNNLLLFEDNCESFGAKHNKKLTGTFGLFSTLSSYFSHHFSTIEGGYLFTDNFRFYCYCLSIRSHGWIRDQPIGSPLLKKNYSNFDKDFKFVLPGLNIRPTEINAVLGLVQLKKINGFLRNRKKNAEYFYNLFTNQLNFKLQLYDKESSFFGFAIILKSSLNRAKVINKLDKLKIETRPIVSGNFLKNDVIKFCKYKISGSTDCADEINYKGFMIGNKSTSFTNKEKKILKDIFNIIK